MAIVVLSPTPEIVLALFAVVQLIVGGTVWSWTRPVAIRLSVLLFAVMLARVFAGTAGAGLAALLLFTGAWLRVRVADATAGLAVFGVAVAILGGASAKLVATFGLIGVGLLLVRSFAVRAARRILRGAPLSAETSTRNPLRPES